MAKPASLDYPCIKSSSFKLILNQLDMFTLAKSFMALSLSAGSVSDRKVSVSSLWVQSRSSTASDIDLIVNEERTNK